MGFDPLLKKCKKKEFSSYMSRPLRIEFPGATYHVESKGGPEAEVFRDEDDKKSFLDVLTNVVARFGWLVHSYSIMRSSYRIVLEVPKGNLSRGMRQLNGVYTQIYNKKHGLSGPVFQGRFKSILFEKKLFLLPLCKHVVSRDSDGQVFKYEKYKWSSYRASAGEKSPPEFLYLADVLAFFGKEKSGSHRGYVEYVSESLGSETPFSKIKNQVLLGSPRFLNEMQPILQGQRLEKKGPKRATRRKSLGALFKKIETKSRLERNELINRAHLEFGYTLMEIGNQLGLHYTTVSKVINK